MNYIKRIVYIVSYAMSRVALWAMVGLMVVVLVAICLRLARVPVVGLYEITLMLGCILTVLAWAYTQYEKGHLRVDFIVSRFPQRAQAIVDSITYLLAIGTILVMTWYSIANARHLLNAGTVYSLWVPIPLSLTAYVISFGCIMLGLMLLIDLFSSLARALRK